MMQCFRVYTEDTNKKTILKEVERRFPDGFTVFAGKGYWLGSRESSIIIEVIRERAALPTVQKLAADIKRINNQEAVYLTVTELNFTELV